MYFQPFSFPIFFFLLYAVKVLIFCHYIILSVVLVSVKFNNCRSKYVLFSSLILQLIEISESVQDHFWFGRIMSQ